MALSTKIDYFDLADTNVVLAGSSSKTPAYAVQATAQGECGDVLARDHVGAQGTVESEYILKSNAELEVILGELTTTDDIKAALTNVTIETAAGSPPTIKASGEILPGDAAEFTTIAASAAALAVKSSHCAQNLMDAVSVGADAHLTSCTLTISCNFTRATKDGTTVAHDLHGGLLTVSATAVSAAGTGTLTAGTGWTANAPASVTQDSEGYTTLTIEVVKDLTATRVSVP